ncbi:MAG: ATP phosphoribosyltransferase [Euryarchaeota archaeon]|nr:ATP phosphoribosyltransferase [Euryarchaeota archaeon]
MALSITLPKGSLEEQTLLLFRQAGLGVRIGEREYSGRIEDPRIERVKVLRPQEIPGYVERGLFDLGISGLDWVEEAGADVVKVADLGYSKGGPGAVRVVVAVPAESRIRTARRIPRGARVTTEYPNLTRRYFRRLGIPVKTLFSYGATEAKVPDLADALVDVTETGTTLRRSGLRIVDTILESTSLLLANKKAWRQKRGDIEAIRTLLLGVVEARGKALLIMNVPARRLDALMGVLPAMKRPTISKLYGLDYYAVETVVEKRSVNTLLPRLKAAGAQDILEMEISKIVR